ncbi:aldo/keto reductase [Haloplasma contractile]|uniref:1-deoxy-D-xylulose-5-phosphate reductoisomerase protein n=1 Tax=Haloplasma contractile SSD-17B TaxID=1033810 RepID=F7Q0H4_9MOLU|nr:aldo/keto reductase [Haloplasma contractile]ERJ12680.1 1-deoxy-D-xylulose-5-phosphate reductoisomerase protein [Haloplasma contractile SSD-17B]
MSTRQEKKIIMGCMGLGGDWNDQPVSKEDEKKAHQVIEAALESGINTFDHADIYTFGKAEQVFGNVLKDNPILREQMTIQSKAGIQLGKGPHGSSHYDNSKDYLINQVRHILKRLNTEYLDTLLIHRPDPLMDGKEVADALKTLKKEGLVNSFGVSNMSTSQIQLIQHYLDEPLLANQLQLSLGHTMLLDLGVNINTTNLKHESGLLGMLEYSQMNNLAIQTWGSLDRGRFTKPLDQVSESDRQVAQQIIELARKYEVSESAILLAWLFRIPTTVHPVIGTTNANRIKSCKDALQIELTREEWYDLWILARHTPLP